MLIIINLQLEREIDFKGYKKYILSLHTFNSKFTYGLLDFFFYFSFVLCKLDLVLVFNLV